MGKRPDPEALDWVGGVGTALTPSGRARLPLDAGENIMEADGVLTAPADAPSAVNSGLSLEARLPERVADDSDDSFLLFSYSGVAPRNGRPKIECADVGAESHSPVVCS